VCCVSPTNFVRNIFYSKKQWARYDDKYIMYRSSCKVPLLLFLLDFKWIWAFLRDSRKITNIKFHENPSSGSRVVPCGRMDRRADWHKEANIRFSQFCESAKKVSEAIINIHSKCYSDTNRPVPCDLLYIVAYLRQHPYPANVDNMVSS